MEPVADRPVMPGYEDMFQEGKAAPDWHVALELLSGARNYWLATVHPAGRPNVTPVWGIWLDDAFWFSAGPESRKTRNLAENQACTVAVDGSEPAVVVEGVAERFDERPLSDAFRDAYQRKYDWEMHPDMAEPIFRLRPRTAFAFSSDGSLNPVRWRFR